MNIKIQLHIMPWEIDHALLIADKLKQSIQYIDPLDKIYIDTALNLSSSVIDWNASKLPKEYFIKRYESICKYFDLLSLWHLNIAASNRWGGLTTFNHTGNMLCQIRRMLAEHC